MHLFPRTRTLVGLLFLSLVIITGMGNGANFQSLAESTISKVSIPNVVFQKGNTANATIYTNSTSALVTTPTTNFPTSYNMVQGTYTSGTLPSSVNAIDSNYFVTSSSNQNDEVEFLFTVSSIASTQLNFTIVQQYSQASLSATIQVYNYNTASYSISGSQGYLAYTSSGTANTDETKTLTITTNPQFYTSAGAAKIKILTTSSNNDFTHKTNFLKLNYYQQTYDYVLKIVNQQVTSYTIKLDASPFTPSNIGRISNFTAWFYSPVSVQLQVLAGSLTIQTGPTYTLGASATIFIAIRLTTTGSGLSTVDSYLRIYPAGSTTTHTDYRLTFKLT